MGKLLNCPFCGGEAEVAYSNDNHEQPYIRCKFGVMKNPKCPASNMYQWQFHSLDEAIKAWNTRTPMDNIVENLEELKEKGYAELTMLEVNELIDEAINIVKQEINNGLG